ncbi:hypothetical protein LZ32DRAFT_612115 [Colletotrichum eremochloae]|nr:hypothetical protein LZ32DRAFT_612115 [Colletotrichum eremochloae]
MNNTSQPSPEALDEQANVETQHLRHQRPTRFRFTDLPPELQDLIWEYTLPDPRVLRVAHDEYSTHSPPTFTFHAAGHPALLHTCMHICRRSSQTAFSHYKPFFGDGEPRPVYFRPKSDILHLDFTFPDMTVFLFFALRYPEAKEIESIAVPSFVPDAMLKMLSTSSGGFPTMKRLLVVTSPTLQQLNRDGFTHYLDLLPLTPDSDGKQRALKLQKSINAERSNPGDRLDVEAILEKLVPRKVSLFWDEPSHPT